MRLIFDALGKPVKVNLLGRPLMLIAGLFIPMAREGVEMLYEFERPFVVDSSPTEQTFGLMPLPLAEGIQHTLDWYRQETD
ncbi:NAD-dependent epimerase/dehydratase [Oscillochloris trichoides DG-6]|uniref:NAD-dependent epimerase/dehydratase n=1 Tax=Oscillochloris trichoides DG-6 TaxID=765420 RepID=E1IEZ7_9CHLR|nr:hypothetical protein [Oscillochloris trichoides]EFO80242.1 NAD-dependent epimerase/dehydratase [Oscillochloris trichoides DG-6]